MCVCFLAQDQMAKLPPLFVPKKPTGLTSKTGLVKIGELPDDVPGKTELNNLANRATQLMNVSIFMSPNASSGFFPWFLFKD